MVPMHIQVQVSPLHLDRVFHWGTEFGLFLFDQLRRQPDKDANDDGDSSFERLRQEHQDRYQHLRQVLGVGVVLFPDLFETHQVPVAVDTTSRICPGQTLVDVEGVLDARDGFRTNPVELVIGVDAPHFWESAMDVLADANRQVRFQVSVCAVVVCCSMLMFFVRSVRAIGSILFANGCFDMCDHPRPLLPSPLNPVRQ